MKRLNEWTLQPFKHGDVRQDGYVFKQYMNKVRADGYFVECWFSPKAWERMRKKANENNKLSQKKMRLTPEGRAIRLVTAARTRTQKTGGAVTITPDWVAEKIEKGVCELTGIKFDLNPIENQKRNPLSPSLDRINSSNKNYSPDNVRVVLTAVNDALGEFGLDIMLPVFKRIIKNANARS
jgi:hypothetical protein